jgi:flagellin
LKSSPRKNDGLTIQVGANTGDELSINIDCASAEYLGVKGLDVLDTGVPPPRPYDRVNNAISQVSSQRAYLGAIQNRLDYKIDNHETSSQKPDLGLERHQWSSTWPRDDHVHERETSSPRPPRAMLAQANSLPQNVLSLLDNPITARFSHHHTVPRAPGRKAPFPRAFLPGCIKGA